MSDKDLTTNEACEIANEILEEAEARREEYAREEAGIRKIGEARECPLCGAMDLYEMRGMYVFPKLPSTPGGDIVVEDAEWEECFTCKEHILGPEICAAIDKTVAQRRQRK
jgi:hypothetical protein